MWSVCCLPTYSFHWRVNKHLPLDSVRVQCLHATGLAYTFFQKRSRAHICKLLPQGAGELCSSPAFVSNPTECCDVPCEPGWLPGSAGALGSSGEWVTAQGLGPALHGGLAGTRTAFPFFTLWVPKSTRRRYHNQTFCFSSLLSCRLATAGRPGKLSAPHFPSLCHFWTCRGGNTFPSSSPC